MSVSMRELAVRAGCSVCTVSKALRGDPKISSATRQRVKESAQALGYRPCPALARVAGRRATGRRADNEPLAFIHSAGGAQGSQRGRLDLYGIAGARERAQELGYHLDVYEPESFSSVEQLDKTLYARGVQGILLGQFLGNPPVPLHLRWERYASVWVGRKSFPLAFPTARQSYFHATRTAIEALIQRGAARIGVLLRHDQGSGEEYLSQLGAALAMQVECPPGVKVFSPLFLEKEDFVKNEVMLRRYIVKHQPDALLMRDMGMYWLLQSMGYRSPRDFQSAALYFPDEMQPQFQGAFGIALNGPSLGREAVNVLDQALSHGNYGERSDAMDVIVPSKIVWSMLDGANQVAPPRVG